MATTVAAAPDQVWLTGETVYLRPVEKDHAAHSIAISRSPYPQSSSRVESWIEEDLDGETAGKNHFTILRRAGDRPVGVIQLYDDVPRATLVATVPALYGDAGQVWKAEAVAILTRWLIDERQVPSVMIALPATEEIVAASLRADGYRLMSRFREKLLIDGVRVDELVLQAFNAEWMATMGDPGNIVAPRTGSGIARPGAPRVCNVGVSPANAMTIGERIVLKPWIDDDARTIAIANRRETETFHTSGRWIPQPEMLLNEAHEDETPEYPLYAFWSVRERETDRFIGEVGLIGIDYVNRWAESASWLHGPEHRGKGYGSEAKHLLLEIAFDVLDLHMLVSWVRTANTRSAAALRKQGYRDAGSVEWCSFGPGTMTGFQTFDVLADEWRALQATRQEHAA
jgi:RimJ/RimL family protein N-acetyltransferase